MIVRMRPPADADCSRGNLTPPSQPVVLRLAPEHVRTSHRNIPNLVREVRRLLALRDDNVFAAGATCANRRVESL